MRLASVRLNVLGRQLTYILLPIAMKITLSGGTGFVGKFFLQALAKSPQEYEVLCLTRDPAKAASSLEPFPFASALRWDPSDATPSSSLVSAVAESDALIHLAGEPVVGTRLSEEKKQRVLRSRVGSTKLLVEAVAHARNKPGVFLCASAIGYYGDQPGSRELDESSPPGEDFLAEVCQAWEGAALEVDPSVRLVRCRIGIVLGPGGGALQKMALPIKMFVGGPIGSGKQVVSWISGEDVGRALSYCLETPELSGPVNLTAPGPVSNEHLTNRIGHILGRPTFLPVPKFALGLVFGEGADVLTSGQRVLPRRLQSAGFEFHHPDVDSALRSAFS